MKFEIKKTSYTYEGIPPCKNAIRATVPNWQVRTCSEEWFDAKYPEKWRDVGTNHQITKDGHIKRQVGTIEIWQVELNTLEDLLALNEEVDHELIISGDTLEIYDDYRE